MKYKVGQKLLCQCWNKNDSVYFTKVIVIDITLPDKGYYFCADIETTNSDFPFYYHESRLFPFNKFFCRIFGVKE